MTQWLREEDALAEDLDSILSTHTEFRDKLSPAPGDLMSYFGLHTHMVHAVHRHEGKTPKRLNLFL